jgi:hypothetical protein
MRQIAWVVACLIHGASPVDAEPLDLRDAQPRAVRVVFEASPPDAPGGLDRHYGQPAHAWFEPSLDPGRAVARVPASEMERVLERHQAVPGSFSDFVWLFDVASGHVLSARVSGSFVKEVDWGFFSTRVVTDTATELGTLFRAGFRAPRSRFGHLIFEFCSEERDCTPVPPRPYDPFTGYVNAVGAIAASTALGPGSVTFSPLGEAIWSEVDSTAVSLGPFD